MNDDQVAAAASSDASVQPAAEAEVEQLRAALAVQVESNRLAVERLRAALLATEPAVSADMVTGATAAEVEASFASAADFVRRVREQALRDAAAAVPAGAPGRVAGQPGSAFEKIRSGLTGLER